MVWVGRDPKDHPAPTQLQVIWASEEILWILNFFLDFLIKTSDTGSLCCPSRLGISWGFIPAAWNNPLFQLLRHWKVQYCLFWDTGGVGCYIHTWPQVSSATIQLFPGAFPHPKSHGGENSHIPGSRNVLLPWVSPSPRLHRSQIYPKAEQILFFCIYIFFIFF